MKIEFPALESEPLIYFLLHSTVFVAVLAGVFFALGLILGRLVWGRSRELISAPLSPPVELPSSPPATRPIEPAVPLLEETLPAVEPKTEVSPLPVESVAPLPVAVIGDVPAMPELAGLEPASKPVERIRQKYSVPRPQRLVHATNGEGAAIAPFSFLLEDSVEADAVETAKTGA